MITNVKKGQTYEAPRPDGRGLIKAKILELGRDGTENEGDVYIRDQDGHEGWIEADRFPGGANHVGFPG